MFTCALSRYNHVHVRVDSNRFLLTHSYDPYCALRVEKRYWLTQASNLEDWQPVRLLIGKFCARHAVSGAEFIPLVHIDDMLCIPELHPAINILLESQKIATSTQCQTSYLHLFASVKD